MATNFLDKTDLAALAPGKHNDGDGLYLDVRSATSASWVFVFTFGGKRDEMGMGSLKKVGLERARELRAKALADLGAGDNPRLIAKGAKLELARKVNQEPALSVYETAKANIKLIAKQLKNERGRKAWVRSMHKDFLGRIADMQPQDVTLADVKPLLAKLYADTPVQADDIRQRLAKLLSWCKAVDLAENLGRFPPTWENPVKWTDNLEHTLDRGEHEAENHPAIAFVELGGFLAQLQAKEGSADAIKYALEWDVISATRANEAAEADWSEIDWANDCWAIKAERMKMRRAHRVPLTDRHHAILDAILGGAEPPTHGPIFSVRKSGEAVSTTGMRKVMQSIRKPDGSEFVAVKSNPTDEAKGITLHGFRAAFATWARSEVYPVTLPDGRVRRVRIYDEAMIEESLAHVVGEATRNDYVRDDFLELRRDLLADWAAYCGKVQEATVVPFRRRKAA